MYQVTVSAQLSSDNLAGLCPHTHPQPSPCNTNPQDYAVSMAGARLWMSRHVIKMYCFYRTLLKNCCRVSGSKRDHVRPGGKLNPKHNHCAEKVCRMQITSNAMLCAHGQTALEDASMTSMHASCCGPAGQGSRDHIVNWLTETTKKK